MLDSSEMSHINPGSRITARAEKTNFYITISDTRAMIATLACRLLSTPYCKVPCCFYHCNHLNNLTLITTVASSYGITGPATSKSRCGQELKLCHCMRQCNNRDAGWKLCKANIYTLSPARTALQNYQAVGDRLLHISCAADNINTQDSHTNFVVIMIISR